MLISNDQVYFHLRNDCLIAWFFHVIFAAMLFHKQDLKKFSTLSVNSEKYCLIIWQEMQYKYYYIHHHFWLSHELKSLWDFIAFNDVYNIKLFHLHYDSWLTCYFSCSLCWEVSKSCIQLSLLVRRFSLIYREELKLVEQNHWKQTFSRCFFNTILLLFWSWQSCMHQNSEWMNVYTNIVNQEKCCI